MQELVRNLKEKGLLTDAFGPRIQAALDTAAMLDRSPNAALLREYRALLQPLEALVPPPDAEDEDLPGLDPVA